MRDVKNSSTHFITREGDSRIRAKKKKMGKMGGGLYGIGRERESNAGGGQNKINHSSLHYFFSRQSH